MGPTSDADNADGRMFTPCRTENFSVRIVGHTFWPFSCEIKGTAFVLRLVDELQLTEFKGKLGRVSVLANCACVPEKKPSVLFRIGSQRQVLPQFFCR